MEEQNAQNDSISLLSRFFRILFFREKKKKKSRESVNFELRTKRGLSITTSHIAPKLKTYKATTSIFRASILQLLVMLIKLLHTHTYIDIGRERERQRERTVKELSSSEVWLNVRGRVVVGGGGGREEVALNCMEATVGLWFQHFLGKMFEKERIFSEKEKEERKKEIIGGKVGLSCLCVVCFTLQKLIRI